MTMLLYRELPLSILLLYAEVHYRFFPRFPSLLHKNEPEVLFDLPARLSPGEDLPIVLIINDVHLFPAIPERVSVSVAAPGAKVALFHFNQLSENEIDHPFTACQRVFVFSIPGQELPSGKFFVNASLSMSRRNSKTTVLNDNCFGTSKRAFECYRAEASLPSAGICMYGDLHLHSQFSQSHVEFGPPLQVIDIMAKSSGLSFVGITDHSYDLACSIDNYLLEDQSIARWEVQKKIIGAGHFSTLFIQGEEISCDNGRGATVHLGALGHSRFIPGSSDGARRNRHRSRQLTIPQVIAALHEQGAVSFAAHPGSRSGLLQQIFLRRGHWSLEDFSPPPDGIQALNDGFGEAWKRGKELWVNLLQRGLRIPLLAGNDAHGDFNRYRAIKMPFLSIYEDFQRYMGYGKTGIYGIFHSTAEILDQIRNGRTFITTGPFVSITHSENPADIAIGIHSRDRAQARLFIHAGSTPEFGRLSRVSALSGSTGKTGRERILPVTHLFSNAYDLVFEIDTTSLVSGDYLRAEAETTGENGVARHAYTSACFF